MSIRSLHLISITSLIALIFLGVLWEGALASSKETGTWMTLKVLPLLFPLMGIIKGRIYTYQWASMLILLYFTEGVVRAWSDQGVSQWLAIIEILLSLIFFLAAIFFVRKNLRAQKQSA